MANPYDVDLEQRPANHVPLTPLSFLARAAAVYPKKTAVIHGDWRLSYRGVSRTLPAPGHGTEPARHRARRHGGHHGPQRAADAGGALRCPHDRRRPQSAELPARRPVDRVHPRARPSPAPDRRSRILFDGGGSARTPARGRFPWSTSTIRSMTGPGSRLGETDYEALLEEGVPAMDVRGAGRRVAGHLPPLHLGNDGESQRRRLSSSRRLPERARQCAGLRAVAALGLSVDLADVPLQRLDVHLGGDGGGRHPRLPPPCRAGAPSFRRSSDTGSRTCAERPWS